MGFSSDVKAVTKTADAAAVSGRTRLQGIYFTFSSSAGSVVVLKNGTTSSGATYLSLNATPSTAGSQDIIIPNDGILFENGIYVDIAGGITSVTLFFVGGAAA
jgi:hypothetical protein